MEHVGIVVDDLEEATGFLEDALGLALFDEARQESLTTRRFSCGAVDIEIIEVLSSEARTRRLRGERARLEHVALEVDDLAATVAHLRSLGIRFTPESPKKSGVRTSYWTEPETTDGVQYQLIEAISGLRDSPGVEVISQVAGALAERGRGVTSVHLVSRGTHGTVLTNGFTTLAPESEIPWHYHNCDESVLIVEGEGVVEVEHGDSKSVVAGDVTFVRAQTAHRFVNPTSGMLRLFWTYGSGHPTRTYVESGQTVDIAGEAGQPPETRTKA